MTTPTISLTPDGTLDEFTARAVDLHIESMGENGWSVMVQQGDLYWLLSLGDGGVGVVFESGSE